MSNREHKLRMTFGLILYWTLRFLPGSWWVCGGWLHWLLPYLGYYCHQPSEYSWRRPVVMKDQ